MSWFCIAATVAVALALSAALGLWLAEWAGADFDNDDERFEP